MAQNGDVGIIPELFSSEQRISKIKSQIDQFEEVFKRVTSGFGTDNYLNDEYHNLIISTRDLSSHLANIQKTIEAGGQDPNLRARAHGLNNQAIIQLRRLQNLGVRVQQHVRNEGGPVHHPPDHFTGDKFASPLVDFTTAEKLQSYQQQQQIQLPSIQDQLDEQRAREMEQLESDIVQVNELFTTLATYVHDQGSLVDSIGDNIEVAYEKVEAGTRQLDTAKSHYKSARRKKCICILIVVIVLFIVALVLGLTLR
ncbi:hypothetical protein EG68_06341 [Paragonimus skrjabini miyazakii]|uniref:t-SNARE coiled-coil homology domain-containing protein n=1 Tax=Paragonimus skrjabini miyazakii TaxID=59628 RepID=A0A8S9YTT9_9TREM|nr:hypothetical protein EG68_06341 [Paragonimus skrjabini miyazakii]